MSPAHRNLPADLQHHNDVIARDPPFPQPLDNNVKRASEPGIRVEEITLFLILGNDIMAVRTPIKIYSEMV